MHFIDRAAALVLRVAPRRFSVFPDGLGDGDLEELVEKIPTPDDPIPRVELAWREEPALAGLRRATATFPSPAAAELAAPARRVEVEKIEPAGGADRVLVLLQMWGDEGWRRRRKLATRLARRGIATVLPIHPYYGRRRAHPAGPPIRTVEEFLRMGLGAIVEARALLASLRESYQPGLAGFSMGSGFSVGASATLPFPVALTFMGAAPSPALAFTGGVLEVGLPPSLRGPGKPRLYAALDAVSALERPVLDHHRRAVVLAARGDGFVPVEDALALAAHWPGSELRLISGGHITLWFRRLAAMESAIARSFERHAEFVAERRRAGRDDL